MRSVTFFNFLLEATLVGSVLIALMLPVRGLLRRKTGSVVVYAAWLLVALRLLLPLSFPNPLMNELRPRLSSNYAARPIADQIRVRTADALYDASKAAAGDDVTALQENSMYQMSVALRNGKLGRLLFIIYCGGAGSALVVLAWRNVSFRLRLRKNRAAILSPETLAAYPELLRKGKFPLPVWLAEGIPAPCLAGFFHLRIVLPASMDPADYPQALRHELMHARMGDPVWNLLRCVCCALHWFNPLVWLAASLSRVDGELACDERLSRGSTPVEREAYAASLTQLASKYSLPELGVQASSMLMKPRRIALRQKLLRAGTTVHPAASAAFLLVAMLLFGVSFFTGEKKYAAAAPVFAQAIQPQDVPSNQPRVQRHIIATEEDAREWFIRLFSSPYVNAEITETPVAVYDTGTWTVTAGKLSAVFDGEGIISAFSNGEVMTSTMKETEESLAGCGEESIYEYLRSFANACMPDVTISICAVVRDRIGSEGRFVTCEAGHEHASRAYRIAVQLEPEVRVISFMLLDTPDRAFIRVSSLAQAPDEPVADEEDIPDYRITMAQALEIARDCVARIANRQEIGSSISTKLVTDAAGDYWLVTFKEGSEERYVVQVDASNGETLAISDMLHSENNQPDVEALTPAPGQLSKADAITIARRAVASQYSFSATEVAAFLVAQTQLLPSGEHWMDYELPADAWCVSFRMPDSDPAFISDYDVLLNAQTGELLTIFDPSNNANG